MKSLRILSTVGLLCLSISSHADFCKQETDDAKKNCQDSAVLAGVNNDSLAATASTAAGTGGIVNKGGRLDSSVIDSSVQNLHTAKESCRIEQKNAKDACEKSMAKHYGEAESQKEIQDNWDSANSYIEGRLNGLSSSSAYLNQQGAVSSQVSSLSH